MIRRLVLIILTFISTPEQVEKSAPQPANVDVLELEPIVILGTRGEYEAVASANVTTLKKDEVAKSPMLVLDDLLRQIPSFNTFRRSSSLVTAPAQDPEAQMVSLRGIGPWGASRALVLVDGIPVNDGYGGWLYWGEVPSAPRRNGGSLPPTRERSTS